MVPIRLGETAAVNGLDVPFVANDSQLGQRRQERGVNDESVKTKSRAIPRATPEGSAELGTKETKTAIGEAIRRELAGSALVERVSGD